MKKAVMVIALVLLVAAGVFAQVGQTYYYKYVETVNAKTGVRSKGSDDGRYITFTRNSCYVSDEKGIQKGTAVYSYQGEENNQYVFMYRDYKRVGRTFQGVYLPSFLDCDIYEYYYFSKDYKRINIRFYFKEDNINEIYNTWSNLVFILEQAPDPAKQGSGPPGGGMW